MTDPVAMPLVNPYLEIFRALEGERDELRLRARKPLIWAYSWAVPDDAAIRAIARHAPIVEWGAGTGYWAWLLAQAGARVRAFDAAEHASPRWLPVEAAEAPLGALSDHALLLCWPPLETPMASRALAAYPGRTLILVGEGRGGRTGDDALFEALAAGWEQDEEREIPRWPGFKDSLRIFRRRG